MSGPADERSITLELESKTGFTSQNKSQVRKISSQFRFFPHISMKLLDEQGYWALCLLNENRTD